MVAGGEERVAAHKLLPQSAARASPVGCVQRVFATVRSAVGQHVVVKVTAEHLRHTSSIPMETDGPHN